MSIYPDTSFLVSVYVTDTHSKRAWDRMAQQPKIFLTPLHRAEWTSAVYGQVFRRMLTSAEAETLQSQFESDVRGGIWTLADMPENVFDTCSELAARHVARLGVRTLDTLHVALALSLGASEFWTFDDRQAKLARAEGLRTRT